MADEVPSRREAELARELGAAELRAEIVEIKTRLDGMDRALRLAEEFPTEIDKAVGRLRELHDERFAALERLLEAQRRAEEKARDKAEEFISGQLKQLERTHESRNETTRTMLDALKERMTLLEGGLSGATSVWGWVVGLIGIIVAALAVGARIPW